MTSKEGYDVLRLIGHNQNCYVSSEYVDGSPLIRWLKYHQTLSKEQLFRMVYEIVSQLAQIHRCRGNPCYQYVNPYSIIVAEDGEIYFLDLGAQSNEAQLRKMQRRAVREYFLPPEENYYQQASTELDIYGLGRTIQYLLSETQPEPELRRGEVLRFQKIIFRCIQRYSKKSFQKVSDIQKYIPKYRERKRERKKLSKKTVLLAVAAAVIAIAAAVSAAGLMKTDKTYRRTPEDISGEKRGTLEHMSGEKVTEKSLRMELGMLYFLEVRDYKKSREYFDSVKDSELAESMSVIAGRMEGRGVSDVKLRQMLEAAEASLSEEDKDMYDPCILQGYAALDSEKDRDQVIRIGNRCLAAEERWNPAEVMGYMAAAYEKNGKTQEAVRMYENQLEEEKENGAKEEIYAKMGTILESAGHSDMAQEKIREGIGALQDSVKLRILYIRIQCRDGAIDRNICVQTIEQFLRELPELGAEEEFQKLMKEYGWRTEGDKVWTEG